MRGDLAAKVSVVLASRAMTGPVFTRTYGSWDRRSACLLARNILPAGYPSGLKARLLLGFCLRTARGPSRLQKKRGLGAHLVELWVKSLVWIATKPDWTGLCCLFCGVNLISGPCL